MITLSCCFIIYCFNILYVSSQNSCTKSETTVNGKSACSGEVIFQENFDSINEQWKNTIRISTPEEEEFVVYDKDPANYFISDGTLHIRPTLMSDQEVTAGAINLKMCTEQYNSPSCSRASMGYHILPPVKSAEIKSKFFNFKYGIVEVRAKLPLGDWIVPQICLEPKDREYGSNFNSGKIVIAEAVGNKYLLNKHREAIGNNLLKAGIVIGSGKKVYRPLIKFYNNDTEWSNTFHNYTFIWKPDSLQFLVDGFTKPLTKNIDASNLLVKKYNFTNEEIKSTWEYGTPLAPFDKEFYVTLGVTVGGKYFPEGSTSSNHEKPWTSNEVKQLFKFWQDRQNWYNTWSNDNSDLQVDYVRVIAL